MAPVEISEERDGLTRPGDPAETVLVTGADGPIGHRVVAALLLAPDVVEVIAVGRRLRDGAWDPITRVVDTRLVTARMDLDDADLPPLTRSVTTVMVLGPRGGLDIDGTGGAEIDIAGTSALLDGLADASDLRNLLVLSSALVYGARRDNPVPLTERARVRPNPSIPAAMDRAQLERVCTDWAADRDVRCTLLRPSVVVGPDNGAWLARSPWSTAGLQVSDRTGPVQFLHVDDLVTAIEVLRGRGVDGAINLAPDGWLTASQVSALKGPAARVRLSRSVAVLVAMVGARLGLAPGDPSMLVASSAPWVVANDRLRALGWEPAFTNEEAYVDSDRGGLWARLTPRHRQGLALGGAAIGLVSVLAAIVAVVRLRLRADSRGSTS
jgi:nucleoside-diphosphate-sugar epimerase